MNRQQIENTRPTVKGLCGLARKLQYQDPLCQLTNNDGSVVGDLLYFFEDNPGACEALIEWIADNHNNDESNEESEDT